MPAATDRLPPALRPHLFDYSGGLGYHLRAVRYRATLWVPFLDRVAAWLAAWQPPTTHLVIIGPSGGYALTAAFLARFERLTVLEPDPLARLILRRRFASRRFAADALDCLADRNGPYWLARRYPDASLLFANVLGQWPPISTEPDWAAALRAALHRHHWASWHDVLSASVPPRLAQHDRLAPAADAASLASRLWGWPTEVCDHDCYALAGRQDGLALWQLAPRQWQVVEWGCHRPDAGLGGPAAE